MEPPSGDGHDPGDVIGCDGLLEHPVGPGSELEFVGVAARLLKFADQPIGFGLDALPRPLLSIHSKKRVAVGGKDLVEQRGCVAPALVVDEPSGTVQLSFSKTVAGKADAPFAIILGCFGRIAGNLLLGGVVGPRDSPVGHPSDSHEDAAHQNHSEQEAASCRPNRKRFVRVHRKVAPKSNDLRHGAASRGHPGGRHSSPEGWG